LAALRTSFDDFFCQTLTSGLVTPRGRKKLPVTISPGEVKKVIAACTKLRDKLLVSLTYATGMRVSEVARLKWQDLDFERNLFHVRQGKGNADRQVSMPITFKPLLESLAEHCQPADWVFQGDGKRSDRHLSPRTIQRVVSCAADLAGISKSVTPHVLRHAFATHLFESGTDIRLIQKLLGHVNLETTCIYIKVARNVQQSVASPLDQIASPAKISQATRYAFQVHTKTDPSWGHTKVTLSIQGSTGIVYFTGIVATEVRAGYWSLELPTLDSWSTPLQELGRQSLSQSQWFEDPDFYRSIRDRVVEACSGPPTPAKLEHALA